MLTAGSFASIIATGLKIAADEEAVGPECAWTGAEEELPPYELPHFDPPRYDAPATGELLSEKESREHAARIWAEKSGSIQAASKQLLAGVQQDIKWGWNQDAAHLLNAVGDSRTYANLYRGMQINDEMAAALLKTEGQTFVLPLSSFSTKQSVANSFARYDPAGENWSIFIRAEDMHGYRISEFVNSQFKYEAEVIVAGRYQTISFQVDSNRKRIEMVVRRI